jgi:hypothetical protein
MMRKLWVLAFCVGLTLPGVAPVAAEEGGDYEATCRRYAVEDGIASDHMDQYIKECVQDLKAAESPIEQSTEPAEPPMEGGDPPPPPPQ